MDNQLMKGYTQLQHRLSALWKEKSVQSRSYIIVRSRPRPHNDIRRDCNWDMDVRHHRVRNITNRMFSLLILPDEAISRIFAYLKAGDTSFCLLKPRDAFSLALTNTRLLRIFRTTLTRIVPHLDYRDRMTISSGHLLSVMRTAGEFVRELHVPRSCLSVVSQIPRLCPQLEKLVVQEDCDFQRTEEDTRVEIQDLFLLPLRSLCIDYPYERTLAAIPEAPQPQEVSLLNCYCDYLLQLCAFALNPPKKLHFHVRFTSSISIDESLDYLRDLCKKVEEFTLKSVDIPDERPERGCSRMKKFMKLLKKDRSHTQSKCKRMVLMGEMATCVTNFVECAHPEAYVEVTSYGQTFVQNSNGVYPTKIPLWDEYLTQDLYRVSHVYVGETVNPAWKDFLSNLCLSKVTVVSPKCFWGVPGKVDIVEVDTRRASHMNWKLIHGAKEVHLMGHFESDVTQKALGSLERLLDQFEGKAVFLERYPVMPLCKSNCILRSLVTLIRDAVDKFESRGGDARSVRDMLTHIRWE